MRQIKRFVSVFSDPLKCNSPKDAIFLTFKYIPHTYKSTEKTISQHICTYGVGGLTRFTSIDSLRFTQYGVPMITDADVKKLKAVFATKDDLKNLVTKDGLKEDLNDMRSQIMDAMDGKLKATERNILDAVDEKFKAQDRRFDAKLTAQTDDIVKDVAKTIMPLYDEHDVRIAALEKQRPLIPS